MLDQLQAEINQAIAKYPYLFDEQLSTGLDRLVVNSPANFASARSKSHLKRLLITQFFLQKKMEQKLTAESGEHTLLLVKLFQSGSRICCAIAFHTSYGFSSEHLLAIFHTLLPGIQSVFNSSYMWFHPELSYQFCYIEVEKMRGQGLSAKELKAIEKSVREQLLTLSPLTPAIFWPYNAEESFRQVQLLQREMQNPGELAHISRK